MAFPHDENHDHARERWEAQDEEEMLRQARQDRLADYAPAPRDGSRVPAALVLEADG